LAKLRHDPWDGISKLRQVLDLKPRRGATAESASVRKNRRKKQPVYKMI
jgi:hypothetical protein